MSEVETVARGMVLRIGRLADVAGANPLGALSMR